MTKTLTITKNVTSFIPPPPIRRFAYIRHLPRGGEDDDPFPQLKLRPDTCVLHDSPSVYKGERIPVRQPVWDWIDDERNNDWKGRTYANRTWINVGYSLPKTNARAECISNGGNVVSIIGETNTHYMIESIPHTIGYIDPENVNFTLTPWLVWLCVMIGKEGVDLSLPVVMGLPTHCYLPLLNTKGQLWVAKGRLELFPAPPVGVRYVCKGGNVYGWANGAETVLLTKRHKNRQVYTDWFRPETFGVLVP